MPNVYLGPVDYHQAQAARVHRAGAIPPVAAPPASQMRGNLGEYDVHRNPSYKKSQQELMHKAPVALHSDAARRSDNNSALSKYSNSKVNLNKHEQAGASSFNGQGYRVDGAYEAEHNYQVDPRLAEQYE